MISISDIIDGVKGIWSFFKRPAQEGKGLKSIEGKWEYTCILKSPYNFMDSGCCHGGTCTIEIIKTDTTTELLINGKRKWHSMYDYKNEARKKVTDLRTPRKWRSEAAAFITNKTFMYKYQIDDGPVEGISFVDINDENKLVGMFYYLPNDEKLKSSKDVFQRIASSKPESTSRVYRVCGDIEFTRIT